MQGLFGQLRLAKIELEMRLAIWTQPPIAPMVRRLFAQARSEYRRNGAFRGITDGITVFFGLLLLDCLLGWPVALRLLYILPVWLIAQRAGRFAGVIAVLITSATMTAIDAHMDFIAPGRLILNLFLRVGVLYGLMRIMEEMEARVRNYSNLATRDALTGVANRIALADYVRRCLERSNLTMEPLAIGMVDCDRFKQLNDTYGHEFGDEVLKSLAKCLRKALPPEALVARTGGDEFVVVLPGRGSDELRRYLDSALVKFLAQSSVKGRCIGFSYGASAFGIDRKTYETIMRAADRDMYLRKSNRAVVECLVEGSDVVPEDLYRAAG